MVFVIYRWFSKINRLTCGPTINDIKFLNVIKISDIWTFELLILKSLDICLSLKWKKQFSPQPRFKCKFIVCDASLAVWTSISYATSDLNRNPSSMRMTKHHVRCWRKRACSDQHASVFVKREIVSDFCLKRTPSLYLQSVVATGEWIEVDTLMLRYTVDTRV